MLFYRVIGGPIFGKNGTQSPFIGDIVTQECVTPFLRCVAEMVSWNHDHQFEEDGGLSRSRIIVLDKCVTREVDPSEKTGNETRTDEGERFLLEGQVVGIETDNWLRSQKVFANSIYCNRREGDVSIRCWWE